MLPSRDHRNWPHVVWWLHGHRTGEQVNSEFGRAETEAGDRRCEHYGIACGIVPTRWRSAEYDDVTRCIYSLQTAGPDKCESGQGFRQGQDLLWFDRPETGCTRQAWWTCSLGDVCGGRRQIAKSSYGQSSSRAMDEYVLDPRAFNLWRNLCSSWSRTRWTISISRVIWSTKYRLDPWTVFLSCGKTFSLHFPSIPGLSVSSISRYVLTTYTANCDDASAYNSRLSTAHKARGALGGNTTITVDDDFSQAEMMRGHAQPAVQQPSR